MFNFDNLANNLPDSFQKGKDSNNYKILSIVHQMGEMFRENIAEIIKSRDISQATGKTLDYYGDFVGVNRDGATDEQYRALIRSKIARNTCDGTDTSILEALAFTFDCHPTFINFVENNNYGSYATVTATQIPIDEITKAGLTIEQVYQILLDVMPAGVHLDRVNYRGSFVLSAGEGQSAYGKGLSTAEGTNDGGTLGYILDTAGG